MAYIENAKSELEIRFGISQLQATQNNDRKYWKVAKIAKSPKSLNFISVGAYWNIEISLIHFHEQNLFNWSGKLRKSDKLIFCHQFWSFDANFGVLQSRYPESDFVFGHLVIELG